MSLTDYVNKRITKALDGIDKSEQLQSVINPELNFRRNSINLYIGRRGSGKTFNVLREMVQLSNLPNCGGYNSFIYCTDKTNDNTVNELLGLVKLKKRTVRYSDMVQFLTDLIDAKNAYQEALEKGLINDITTKCRNDLFKALDLSSFTEQTPGTIVLYDDAINIFKVPKYKPLLDLLHQNRQPRITYFLCMQDGFALPPQIKRNLDTCIIFGGYNDAQMMSMLLRQLNSSSQTNPQLLQIYSHLSNREGLLFDYLRDHTSVRVVAE
jgi:hypothetical protein